MKVLKATPSKYQKLNNYTNGRSTLKFAKDNDNNFIVGIEVLYDLDFLEIRKQLELLPLIDYLPKETVI